MDADREAIIERIKKILARTAENSGATEAEIEQAMAFARKMMDKFNVSQEEIYKSSKGQQSIRDQIIEVEVYKRMGRLDRFDQVLGKAVSHILDLKSFSIKDIEGCKVCQRLMFAGLPQDVEVGVLMYQQFLVMMRAAARLICGKGWNNSHVSYCYGFSDRLCARAQELQNRSSVACHTTAIVVLKNQIIDEVMASRYKFDKAKKSNAGSTINPLFWHLGQEDANKVDLGVNQKLPK